MYNSNSIVGEINNGLAQLLSGKPEVLGLKTVGGGSINETFIVDTTIGSYFIKANDESFSLDMFQKETLGLNLLHTGSPLRVPEVIGSFNTKTRAVLILEYLDPVSKAADYWDRLGEGLAILHAHSNKYYGLDHSNYIGSLIQNNKPHTSWVDFFIQERIRPQLRLSTQLNLINPATTHKFETLFDKLADLMPAESPALVHGDLWSGNIFQDNEGSPCLIDPAVYYGHREMDIAFTRLFGGFHPKFYEAYDSAYPLEPKFIDRLDLYNLYPLLVHLNLFGRSYLGQIQSILTRFT